MLRPSTVIHQLNAGLDRLVHPSVQIGTHAFERQKHFITLRLAAALVAMGAMPVLLPVSPAFLVLTAMLVPALYLARTGDERVAQGLSLGVIAVSAVAVSGSTGGLLSPAAFWLLLLPLEGAVARRPCTMRGGIVLMVLGGLALFFAPSVAPQNGMILTAAALGLGALYITGLAGDLQPRDEVELNACEARYTLLAENIADVIVRHASNGSVTFVSSAIQRVFGLHDVDFLGNGLFERVHVADRPAYLRALSQSMTLHMDIAVEFRLRKSSDTAFTWVEMRCRPMRLEGGTEVVTTLADISLRKEQEEILATAHAEIDRAQQAKGRFLANVSHELRTPLNAILGFSEMLMNEETLRLSTARRHEYAGLINASGGHLLNLVNSILDMSKLESGNFQITPEPFEVAPLVESVANMLSLKAEENGSRIVLDLPAHLPELNADKRACRQILINLVSNAVKFTGRDDAIIIGARNEGHHLALFVADTGAGIGEDDLARLGTPFFQASNSYDKQHQGTGLGLSVVRGLVELHGGRMDIVSRLGEGTRVTVHLPSAGAYAAPVKTETAHEAALETLSGLLQRRA